MSCTVVCISRALGAGGEEIGRIVAALSILPVLSRRLRECEEHLLS